MTNRVHFNTFGGNPISMTQGLATLEVIDRENIQENARVVGEHLKSRLLELQERQPLIGEVRGMGLMLGVELVRDRADEGAGQHRDGRGAGAVQGARPADRQGRPVRQHAAHQAADVPDQGRRRFPRRLSR